MGFRCHYTGVLLDITDQLSPWYLTFDHRTPGKKGGLVVCAAWINSMKNRLTEEEFKAVIIEFARCKETGEPFNMAVARFKYWHGWVPKKPKRMAIFRDMRRPKIGVCKICSDRTVPYSLYCPVCQRILIVFPNIIEHAIAMEEAWDKEKKAFICYLTGLKIELKDRSSPLYHTFDHRIPGQPGTLKMTVAFANVVKTALSDEEFWLVVNELANHFKTGQPFNRDIVKFAYWKGFAKARLKAMNARKAKARARRAKTAKNA